MTRKRTLTYRDRRGAIMVMAALLMTALVGLIAFSVDYGYLLKVRTDLQRLQMPRHWPPYKT